MLQILGFTYHEHRLAPWILGLGILAMVICFSVFDFVDRNPYQVQSLFSTKQSNDPPPSLSDAIRQLRNPSAR